MISFHRFCAFMILIFLVHFPSLGDIHVQQVQNGILFCTAGKIVEVQFYTSTIVRIQKWNDTAQPASTSLVVIRKPSDSLHVDIKDEGSVLSLRSSDLFLSIEKTAAR